MFVQYSLFVPGYVVIKQFNQFKNKPAIQICSAYAISLTVLASLAIGNYVLPIRPVITLALSWLVLLVGSVIFFQKKYFIDLAKFKIPIISLLALSFLASAIVSLSYTGPKNFIPDPEVQANRNYEVFNVKVLNISHTNANDNYIPYRQAQFFTNKLKPASNPFIAEWGVGFFQRTPLMGAVTAFYFNLFRNKPPIDYLWSSSAIDPSNTYIKFQIIASILNSLFVVPAYYLLKKLFNKKTAIISVLFIFSSHFFLYNNIFSWPKSLVAFFILLSWILLLEDTLSATILAAAISALAYFTHDLAILYIAASLVFLLSKKRIRDMFILLGGLFAALGPWWFVASVYYKKPSSFYLYPFAVDGIPTIEQKDAVLQKFFHTPALQLIHIRINTLYYLFAPYTFLEKTTNFAQKLWAFSIFTIPGSLGLGLIIPSTIGFVKKIAKTPFWCFILTPILLVLIIFGWSSPGSIGAIHFSQPITVILIGCGVWWLLSLTSKTWLLLAYIINTLYLAFYIIYTFSYNLTNYPKSLRDIFPLTVIATLLILSTWLLYIFSSKKTSLLKSLFLDKNE